MKKIVSKNIRIRNKNFFKVGRGSIIDDFSYFSTRVIIGDYTHLSANIHVGGGSKYQFKIGNFCSVSSGVRIWCESNNYFEDIPIVYKNLKKIKNNPIKGDVNIDDFCVLGSNSVIMPNNNFPQGVAIGALSFVPENFIFKSWSVYAGVPVKFIKKRNKKEILKKFKIFRKYYTK